MNEKKGALRELLEQGQVFAPCVYDCLSLRCVELAGFKAALLSGGAYAYSMCGIPDMGLLNPDELVWILRPSPSSLMRMTAMANLL
jgi:methylisocitrate lyase